MRAVRLEPVTVFARLWDDDGGAVLATEWLLVTTLLVLGLIPGLIAIRQGVLSELGDVATATSALDQSYGFTGQETAEYDRDDNDRTGNNNNRGGIRGASNNTGRGFDPVAEAASQVTTLDLRNGRLNPNSSARGYNRGIRPASYYGRDNGRGGNSNRNNDNDRPIQAFTAGSAFIEQRHIDGTDRGANSQALPAEAIGSDGKPCD